jgi:hypothetical protein
VSLYNQQTHWDNQQTVKKARIAAAQSFHSYYIHFSPSVVFCLGMPKLLSVAVPMLA